MKPISKDEANYIRQHSPTSHVTLVNKQKGEKQKKYYVEETKVVLKLLKEFNSLKLQPKNNIKKDDTK